MNDSELYLVGMDPKKRANLQSEIDEIVETNPTPFSELRGLITEPAYRGDDAALLLITEAMLRADPTNQRAGEILRNTKTKIAESRKQRSANVMKTEPAINPATRAAVQPKIDKILREQADPLRALRVLWQSPAYREDLEAQLLVCQAMFNRYPNDPRAASARDGVEAKLLAEQKNKSSSLSSSPDAQSSTSHSPSRSSGEVNVSPELQAKMTEGERRQREEFIKAAKQEIPEAIARMRADMQAEADRLAKELKELPTRKKQAEEIVARINRALQEAKIPVEIELDALGKKPYNKWKATTKIKYLKGKITLQALLLERQQAGSSSGGCDETIPEIENQYNGFICALGFFDRLVFETEDFNKLYEHAKPIIERGDSNNKQQEISQLQECFIHEKLKAISQADVDTAEKQLAEVEKQRSGYIQSVVKNQFPAVKAQVIDELGKHKRKLQNEIERLDREVAEETQKIEREEAYLRNAGIPIVNKNTMDRQAVNAGRFGVHKSVPASKSQQVSVSELIKSQYGAAPPSITK